MKYLVIIPARKDSKRLPKKNYRQLGGKSLIEWSIEDAFELRKHFDCKIRVSTNDENIIKIAKNWRLDFLEKRHEELCNDTTSSVDVCISEYYKCKKFYNQDFDALILLQPTTPFRELKKIMCKIKLFEQNRKTLLGARKVKEHPYWMLNANGSPYSGRENINMRSQNLPELYILTGSIYVIEPYRLISEKSFISKDVELCIFEDAASKIDIDDENDWIEAENYLKINGG